MEEYQELDWDSFTDRLLSYPPQDPFSFQLQFLSEIKDQASLSELLGRFMLKASQKLFQKEIAHLSPDQESELQKYFRSFGFQFKMLTQQNQRYIASLGKTTNVNAFQIDFEPCPYTYMPQTR